MQAYPQGTFSQVLEDLTKLIRLGKNFHDSGLMKHSKVDKF
jgi:hypothetical protein